jgi:hypothetical protein
MIAGDREAYTNASMKRSIQFTDVQNRAQLPEPPSLEI